MIIVAIILLAIIFIVTIVALDKRHKKELAKVKDELAKTRDENAQFDAEQRMLIRNISHDLKTPITAIKGYAEGIMDGVANTPEKLDKYVHTIYTKAIDMDGLIDELTLYTKIDTNRNPYNFHAVDANEYFAAYAEDIKDDLDNQDIELSYYSHLEDDKKIIGDEEQLRRVLNNIISNSVKYMNKKKGLISIRLRDEEDFVMVEIEDNGKGIPKKDIPYVFDRFYRTDLSRNSKTGGSGIGLSIARKIVEDHGGKIYATSDEGAGTVMHFTLKKYEEA